MPYIYFNLQVTVQNYFYDLSDVYAKIFCTSYLV